LLGLLQIVVALAVAATGSIEGKIAIRKKDGTSKEDRSSVVIYLADIDTKSENARAEIRQVNQQFSPRVLAVAAGTTVTFPNEDFVEHNVFSHSANAEFDLGRFGRGPGKSRVFDDIGVAEIFCNVHKEMVAYVVVTPSSAFAVSAPDGSFSIKQVPPGRHRLVIWERFARPRAIETWVDVRAGGTAQLNFAVQEQVEGELPHKNKFGVEYSPLYR
jgi:plastocyanin